MKIGMAKSSKSLINRMSTLQVVLKNMIGNWHHLHLPEVILLFGIPWFDDFEGQ